MPNFTNDVPADALEISLDLVCDNISYFTSGQSGDELLDTSYKLLIHHVIHNFIKDGKVSFSGSEIADKLRRLLASHTLWRLTQEGYADALIDENGNDTYKVTEKGREALTKMGIMG